jgi:hypothetical protein
MDRQVEYLTWLHISAQERADYSPYLRKPERLHSLCFKIATGDIFAQTAEDTLVTQTEAQIRDSTQLEEGVLLANLGLPKQEIEFILLYQS